MKTQTWLLIAGTALILAAAIVLTPVVLAQGPLNGSGLGYGNGSTGQGAFGSGPRMMQRGFMAGPMGNGTWGPGAGPGRGPVMGRGGRWGGPDNSLVSVTAEVLEIERADLIAELQNDKTLAEVIAAHEVAPETVVEAFLAPRAERLAELVAAGQLTQEQADAMLATMKAQVTVQLNETWSPRGPGFSDEDGDGVCDHAGRGQGFGRGYGPGFVDEDGDGVCDYAGRGGPMGQRMFY